MRNKNWDRLELTMVNAPHFRALGGQLFNALWLGIELDLRNYANRKL